MGVGHTFSYFDYQKERPDSEISNAESIPAPLQEEANLHDSCRWANIRCITGDLFLRTTTDPSGTLLRIMRLHLSLFFLVAIATSVFADNATPVADRLRAQHTLFE